MILTDGVHLVSDTSLEELHEFAKRIGLKREWFQGPPKHNHPHYDLFRTKVQKAIAEGAQVVTSRQLVKRSAHLSQVNMIKALGLTMEGK